MSLARSVKAFVFDCDGTLVDSEFAHFQAWQHAFQQEGHSLEESTYADHMCGVCDCAMPRVVDGLLGKTRGQHMFDLKYRWFTEQLRAGLPGIEPTIRFLRDLVRQREQLGIRLAVASGASKDHILASLECLGLEGVFDAVVSGKDDLRAYQDPEGTNKPKPYVYIEAARQLGVQPEECVAIEDSHTGVKSAVSAGCITVAIPSRYAVAHDFAAADHRLDSLEAVSPSAFLEKYAVRRR